MCARPSWLGGRGRGRATLPRTSRAGYIECGTTGAVSIHPTQPSHAPRYGSQASRALQRLKTIMKSVGQARGSRGKQAYTSAREQGKGRRRNLPHDDVKKDNGGDNTSFNVILDSKGQNHDDDKNQGQTVGDLSHDNLPNG